MLTTYMSRGFLTCGDLLVLGEDLGRLVVSPRLLFIWPLEREIQCTSRHSCASPLPVLWARNRQPHKSSGILFGDQGLSQGWLGRVRDGGGGEVRGAAEYKGDERENAVSSP